MQLLNLKVALFFLAFLPQFVDPDRAATSQVLVLGAIVAMLGVSISSLYALAAGAVGQRVRQDTQGFARGRRYLTSVVYIGLGAVAALTGTR